MKRSERKRRESRECFGWGSVLLMASGASGVAAMMPGRGAAVLWLGSAFLLVIGIRMLVESRHFARQAREEAYWETEREIRN